jgi:hypothetical protein
MLYTCTFLVFLIEIHQKHYPDLSEEGVSCLSVWKWVQHYNKPVDYTENKMKELYSHKPQLRGGLAALRDSSKTMRFTSITETDGSGRPTYSYRGDSGYNNTDNIGGTGKCKITPITTSSKKKNKDKGGNDSRDAT